MLAWLQSLLSSPTFWLIFLAMVVLGLFSKITLLRKIPVSRTMWTVIGVIGLLIAFFGASALGIGSLGSGAVSGGIPVVTAIQTTTAFDYTANGYAIADSGTDDQRLTVLYLNETHLAGNGYIDSGVFQVWRRNTADNKAASCTVSIAKPPRYDIADTTYHIVDEDADTGRMFAYVIGAATSTAATATSPRETTSLAFGEGVVTGFVGLNITLDETGFDPLTQYDTKDINVDLCGYPYTIRIVKNDA